MMRTSRILALLIFCLVLAGTSGLFWLATSLPRTTGTLALPGLARPVEIYRDADGIPHLFAQSEEDAAFALGVLHAQDRLWQMEQMRRFGAGRLAEIFGEALVPMDRLTRTLGLARAADSSYAALDPPVRAQLDAYAAGVNAVIGTHHGAWPPEFLLLGVTPEPWRPRDSLLWAKAMGVQLSGRWKSELNRARLAGHLSPVLQSLLWPEEPGGASNAWTVSGARSRSGKPLLANDPHLGFTLPGAWYLAQIDTPTLKVTGATAPGIPFVLLGHNQRIAWGLTTTGGATDDLFIEKRDPQDPTRYLTPGGPVPFTVRRETIAVRGAPAVTFDVRETRHGPLIEDDKALQATWLAPGDRTAEAIYGVDRARDWSSFTAALEDFGAPEQNFTYADSDGHIGFYAAGRVPLRKAGDGTLPVPGWDGAYDWTGYIPFADLPHLLDPPGGVFVNANDKVTPPAYPYLITRDWGGPHRAQRIGALLAALPVASLDDFAAIQGDTLSLAAKELLPALLQGDPPAEIRHRMEQWDGRMDRSRPEPLIFAAWLREVSRLILAPALGDALAAYWNGHDRVVRSAFADHPELCAPRPCRAVSAEAMDKALAWIRAHQGTEIDRWQWGEAHRAQFRHLIFDHLPLLGAWIDVLPPADGSDDTIDRASADFADDKAPFAAIHGTSYRGLFDLADLSRSRFMIAAGQSGNPFSRHFADLAVRWQANRTRTLDFSREALAAQGADRLTLLPGP